MRMRMRMRMRMMMMMMMMLMMMRRMKQLSGGYWGCVPEMQNAHPIDTVTVNIY